MDDSKVAKEGTPRRFSTGGINEVGDSPGSDSRSPSNGIRSSFGYRSVKENARQSPLSSAEKLLSKSSPGFIESPQRPTRRPSLGRDSPLSPAYKSPGSPTPLSVDKHVTRRRTMTTAGRDGRAIAGPDWRGQDDTRLDLRAQMIRSLDSDLVNLTGKLEFVYLRDNKLSALDGIEALKKVKVLDLSYNELKSASLQPLGACKSLQQLYLAGNHLNTLESLPKLPNLEFLSVAQNELEALSFAVQPKLQVLAATRNLIYTFESFAVLPVLESLRLDENPINEVPEVAVAAKVLVGPSLQKFNDEDLTLEEIEAAAQYPAITPMCIREGWEFCHFEEAEESMMNFLQTLWAPVLPPNFLVRRAHIDWPQEEEICHCELLLESTEELKEWPELKYQWSRSSKSSLTFTIIEGEEGQDFTPRYSDIGSFLRVDVFPVVNGVEYGPLYLISPPVNRGSGLPRISTINVEGEAVEGNLLKGKAEVAWCSAVPGKSISNWWRHREGEEPSLIKGSEGTEYLVTLDDVGSIIEFTFTPVSAEGLRGEIGRVSTAVIRPADPSIQNLQLLGEAVCGSVLTASGEFRGGREGKSSLEWLREDVKTGETVALEVGSKNYTLVPEDVGSQILFRYTPVSTEGLVGETVNVRVGPIKYPAPRIADVVIDGELVEGGTIRVSGRYSGGTEGPSKVQWFVSKTANITHTGELEELVEAGTSKELLITLKAVGQHVVAKYTPIRTDGEIGKSVVVITSGTVGMLPPSITSISLSGDLVEGSTLVAGYVYYGGHEGKSQYGWYRHKDSKDSGIPIKDSQNVLKYTLRLEDVGQLISFKCLPVRSDEIHGESRSIISSSPVEAGPPRILSLRVLGDPVEGNVLIAVKDYRGGIEGGSILQWHVTKPDGTREAIRGAASAEYVTRGIDLDNLISVSCVPVRADGIHGPVVTSPLVGPITAANPRCVGLKIVGPPVEGRKLFAEAQFRGGERGPCTHKWYRQSLDGTTFLKSERDFVLLSAEDVGSRILLEFTPIRADLVVGEMARAVSEIVEPGEPTIVELALPERCEEGIPVDLIRRYTGGIEGEGKWGWYRSPRKPPQNVNLATLQRVAHTSSYTPTLEDVENFLVIQWTPERQDGKVGSPKIAISPNPVVPGWPVARNVSISQLSLTLYEGSAEYVGGQEGHSICSWHRKLNSGELEEIPGANGFTYSPANEDYASRLVFGYTPKRSDGVTGTRVLSQPSGILLPELPKRHGVTIVGTPAEGESLLAAEIVDEPWEKFKKEATFQWLRGSSRNGEFELLPRQREGQYDVKVEDVGHYLRCACTLTDIYGRSAPRVESTIGPIAPGKPHMESLVVEGSGHHSSVYSVKGRYVGGKEGPSSIQWFRTVPGSDKEPDAILGETGLTYEATADDVGFALMVKYTPVREDGEVGQPVTTVTQPITIEPAVAADVNKIVENGSAKFETQQQGGTRNLERRVVDVNKKRIKVVRPGTRTSFSTTEVKGTYDPPFKVILHRSDPFQVRIKLDKDSEVELVLHSRHARDVIALAIRRFAQLYYSRS